MGAVDTIKLRAERAARTAALLDVMNADQQHRTILALHHAQILSPSAAALLFETYGLGEFA